MDPKPFPPGDDPDDFEDEEPEPLELPDEYEEEYNGQGVTSRSR